MTTQSGTPSRRANASWGLVRAVVCLGLLASVIYSAAPAFASQKRLHVGAFGGSPFGAIANPGSVAVDQDSGDVLVVDLGDPLALPTPIPATIQKFDSSGSPAPFSALNGSNAINGSDVGPDADQTPDNGFSFDPSSQVAIDNSGGATDGNIYVTDSGSDFSGAHAVVDVFSASGAYLGQLDGSTTPQGRWADTFAYPCGIAVDPAGNVYVSTAFGGQINRYAPVGAVPTDADYDDQIDGVFTCGLAADSTGAVYGVPSSFGGSGPVTKYVDSDFGTVSPSGTELAPNATAVAVALASGDVFVDEGQQIQQYDDAGTSVGDPFGSAQLSDSHGIAVRSASDRVYASDAGDDQVHAYGPVVTIPDVGTGTASSVTGTTATLEGTVDPDGVALTDCRFEYGTDSNYGQDAPCVPAAGAIPTGSGEVAVSSEIAGLDPGERYHFRLVAANADATTDGEGATFATTAAPDALTLSAGDLNQTSATLAGRVNPRNQAGTTYHFEWGTSDCSVTACASLPPAPEPLGFDDAEPRVVTAELEGLQPASTYHFRLVATNDTGTSEGLDRTFVTSGSQAPGPQCPNADLRADQGSTQLPDCRAYEVVSPPDKNGADILNVGSMLTVTQAAPSGDAVAYGSLSTFAGESGAAASQYLSRRGPAGWSTVGLNPPRPQAPTLSALTPIFSLFSPDLSRAVVSTRAQLTPGATPEVTSLYLRDTVGTSYRLVTAASNPLPPESTKDVVDLAVGAVAGLSSDLDHVVFEDGRPLTAEAAPNNNNKLWEWSDGQLHLVSVLPDGTPADQPAVPGGRSAAGTIVKADPGANFLSADGSKIFFTASGSSGDGFNEQLFVRIGGQTPSPETVHVSAPETPLPDSQSPVSFQGASVDGSVALFVSPDKLTADSTATPESPGLFLWRADAAPGSRLTDLTSGDPDGGGIYAEGSANTGAAALVGMTDDATDIYFVARGQLAAGAVAGAPNLYLWREGDGLRLVATLDGTPNPARADAPPLDASVWGVVRTGYENLGERPHFRDARTTADGSTLLFASRARLTGYDNAGHRQLYLYDAASDRLRCVSCNPRTESSQADASLITLATSSEPFISQVGQHTGRRLPRNLSPDGRTVFFDSREALVPRDTNGQSDVYRWRDGELRLLSGGQGPGRSLFVDADASGENVFFTTRDALVGSDGDSIADLYVARVDGGIPEQQIPPPCTPGLDCQPDSSTRPDLSDPGSQTLRSPGGTGQVPRAAFAFTNLTAAQRSALARGRRVALKVKVNRAGRISVTVTARIGKKNRTVAHASRSVRKAGTARLKLRLGAGARARLGKARTLKASLLVRFSGARQGKRARLNLSLPARAEKNRASSRTATTERGVGR